MEIANRRIRQQVEQALRLPAEERLRALLESTQPMAMVRALPDADFYLTVREIGPQSALPILALASSSQIEHLLDLEGWRKDRFDPVRCGAWVALLVEAGEATVRRFVRSADDETLILLFRLWARVKPLDIDHEEPTRGHGVTETGDERGIVSPDGANMLSPDRSEHALAVRRLAEVLFFDNRDRYLGIVRSALFELPSEVEETALQWRTSRLEEHGYPAWEEALSVYARPSESAPSPNPSHGEGALVAPRAALHGLAPAGTILAGLEALPVEERERVLFGLNALVNRVLVADNDDPGSMEGRGRVVARAGSYVGLALEARNAKTGAAAALILSEVSAVDLFREGYAKAADLQARARALSKWIDLIDAPLAASVRALLLPRPLYVALDEADPATGARDFRTVGEIEETRVTLELSETLGEALLTRRGLTAADVLNDERRPFEDTPRFSTLLLTALAWHATKGEIRVGRLPSDVVSDFLRTTASRRTADSGAPDRAMIRLIDALAGESNLPRRPAVTLRAFGTNALSRLAVDCGNLDPGTPVTPRVVGCLRLA